MNLLIYVLHYAETYSKKSGMAKIHFRVRHKI